MFNPRQYIQQGVDFVTQPNVAPYAVGVPAAVGALYGANALASGGEEDWTRTAANTAGNLAGGLPAAAAAYRATGNPYLAAGAGVAGALAGGYASDRIADQFDESGVQTVDPIALLNQHLAGMSPYEQEAVLRQQLQQAQLAQREQQRAMRESAMQQYGSR